MCVCVCVYVCLYLQKRRRKENIQFHLVAQGGGIKDLINIIVNDITIGMDNWWNFSFLQMISVTIIFPISMLIG